MLARSTKSSLVLSKTSALVRKFSTRSIVSQAASVEDLAKEYHGDNVNYGELSKAQKAFLDRVIRVDQAGELGANYIYMGQYAVLASKYPHLKPILQHMWDQEIHHHNTFNKLQTQRRVRPSIITPLWKVGAVALGAGTALIGKEAAMACTVAVETVIGGHYNQQLRVLMNQYDTPIYDKETGVKLTEDSINKDIETSPEIEELKHTIKEFRDEELEHLDTALEHDAEKAVPYILLTEGIKLICRGAIWTAERI
ncbi:DMQ mono-oxygenase/Ubiquinone biosynthesis protein COQ7/CLK-1/CAT5 [Scheffersomyces coipomensis]|uniref:DMQ mono-oxygenase/Ubiquinone biosynthesis protein COQ7/CLK-1/CAT5 n=1 Tax=Scheffersomyces coipomensis TaxID=1788519 RepID=UPI00315DA9B6